MKRYPKSTAEMTGGFRYFPRMLDKIRLHAAGELDEQYLENLGAGGDGLCCGFLHISYDAVKERVLAGGTDDEIFAWCQEHGRALNETDIRIWNGFMAKLGWNDPGAKYLARYKAEAGIADRDDIQTMPQFIDYDEGRLK
jgi:hypothetical protein